MASKLPENISTGLTHNTRYSVSSSYRALVDLLAEYKISSKDVKTRACSNIIDMGRKISYNIPVNALPVYFNTLEKCRKEGLVLNFAEKQENVSGIMLDFDILQQDEKSQLTNDHFSMLTRMVLDALSFYISPEQMVKITSYAMVLKKKATEYKQDSKCYKDGFHMIFPSIKIPKSVKKLLIKKIIEDDIITTVFDDVKFNDLNSILDTHSVSVPTLLPGNCKAEKIPYDIEVIYRIDIRKGRVSNLTQLTENEISNLNLSYDFSVNYSRINGITKNELNIKPEILSSINNVVELQNDNKQEDDLSIISMNDPDFSQIQRILDILKPFRCSEYKYWFGIITALAYTNSRYKPLAYRFSEKRPEGVRASFERTWEDAISSVNRYAYTKDMIYSYARADNPEAYAVIIQDAVLTTLMDFIYEPCINGSLDHWHYAQLLKGMVGSKYRTDDAIDRKCVVWYEFVTEDDIRQPGQLYKWRSNDDPYTLREYLSIKMKLLFNRAIRIVGERKDGSADEGEIKYFNSLIKAIKFSCRKLFNHGFKNCVIKEAENAFREPYLSRNMDKEEEIIGVENGVLELTIPPTLIEGLHGYKITRSTTVTYRPIDPNNAVVRAVFKSLWDLFPVDEFDAFLYIMYHFSTSLTGRIKASLFLIITGGGANGKSYLLELMRCILGDATNNGYGAKLPIEYLIEKSRSSNEATPVLMPLIWARSTYFSESGKNNIVRSEIIKPLTGQEVLSFRCLFSAQINIIHKSIFTVATNYELILNAFDYGSKRRIRTYKFKTRFCTNPDPQNKFEKLMNPTLTMKKTRDPEFLSAALSILTMFLGLLDMKHNGDMERVPSNTIERETEEYINRHDTVNKFITERVVVSDTKRNIALTDVIDHYCRWYDSNIKEQKHERHDILSMFINSSLSKFIIVSVNGVKVLINHRILGPAEEKEENETYISSEKSNVEHTNTIYYENSDDALNALYREYMKLSTERKTNNI